MALDKLIQVGSGLWLDPDEIVGVRRMEEYKPLISKQTGELLMKGHPEYTQIIVAAETAFGSSRCYLSSDWLIDRVNSALGLVNADGLDDALNRE